MWMAYLMLMKEYIWIYITRTSCVDYVEQMVLTNRVCGMNRRQLINILKNGVMKILQKPITDLKLCYELLSDLPY